MSKLGWITLQGGIVAFWLWVDFDLARESGEPSHPGAAFGVGLFFAFLVTAAIVVVRDFIQPFRRTHTASLPSLDAGSTTGLISHIDQAGEQRDGLLASSRHSREPPKLLP